MSMRKIFDRLQNTASSFETIEDSAETIHLLEPMDPLDQFFSTSIQPYPDTSFKLITAASGDATKQDYSDFRYIVFLSDANREQILALIEKDIPLQDQLNKLKLSLHDDSVDRLNELFHFIEMLYIFSQNESLRDNAAITLLRKNLVVRAYQTRVHRLLYQELLDKSIRMNKDGYVGRNGGVSGAYQGDRGLVNRLTCVY